MIDNQKKVVKNTSDCKHEQVTIDEIYGELFCEKCGSFVEKK